MWPRLLLTINWKFAVDFFARGLHTRTAVARLPLRQLGFLVYIQPQSYRYRVSINCAIFCLSNANNSIGQNINSLYRVRPSGDYG